MKYRNIFPDPSTISSRSRAGFPWDLTPRRETSRAEWTPAGDLYQRGDRFVVEIDLPGVSREDLSLDLEEGRLTLEGHRNDAPWQRQNENSDDPEASRTYYRRERSKGAFRRTFALPDDLDEENVSARLNDGVLTIEMIRRSPATQTIEVEGPSVTASMESDTRESSEYIRDGEEEK